MAQVIHAHPALLRLALVVVGMLLQRSTQVLAAITNQHSSLRYTDVDCIDAVLNQRIACLASHPMARFLQYPQVRLLRRCR